VLSSSSSAKRTSHQQASPGQDPPLVGPKSSRLSLLGALLRDIHSDAASKCNLALPVPLQIVEVQAVDGHDTTQRR
jgi:hypothetical protein